MHKSFIAFGLSFLLAACSRTGGEAEDPQGANAEGAPDFDAMLAREATGLQTMSVQGPNDAWSAQVTAAGTPKIERGDGFTMIEIPIGTEAPVLCHVFDEDVDTGGTLSQVLRNADEKVDFKRTVPRAIELVGETPVVSVDALYTAPSPKGNLVGLLKLAVHPYGGRPVLCIHDELGYRKSFDALMAGLCESLKPVSDPARKSAFTEIHVATIGDMPVGYAKSVLSTQDGRRMLQSTTTMLVPTSEAEMVFTDEYMIEFVDAQGRIEEGHWIKAQGGELGMNVKLTHDKGAQYRYEGEISGKAIKGEFKATDPRGLPSTISTARRLSTEARKAEGFSLKEQGYMPDVDPTNVSEVTYSRGKSDPPGDVQLDLGTRKFAGHLDEHGLLDRFEVPVGAAAVRFERKLIRGKL